MEYLLKSEPARLFILSFMVLLLTYPPLISPSEDDELDAAIKAVEAMGINKLYEKYVFLLIDYDR
jgi:hypothetical protein